MAGYFINIEKATMQNDNFRKVLNTAQHSQLVVMSLLPEEEIGTEVHDLDQFIRFESGRGKVILDGKEHEVEDDWAVVIPAGVEHNVINTSDSEKMKLYSIYSPPEHPEGTRVMIIEARQRGTPARIQIGSTME
jgi:mannose-6-phosphate isomerase-like protein (cupin superfamily)